MSSTRNTWNKNCSARRALICSFLVIAAVIPGVTLVPCIPRDWFIKHIIRPLRQYRRNPKAFEMPYRTSSYYRTTTRPVDDDRGQEQMPKDSAAAAAARIAVVRPFCEFDTESTVSTFDVWDKFVPCSTHEPKVEVAVDLFLHYSQSYDQPDIGQYSIGTANKIIEMKKKHANNPDHWTRCFQNIYFIEGRIARDADLYIPSAQEELYNWVAGPNLQFQSIHRTIQSGAWGSYEGFYLLEGDVYPRKKYWLDALVSEILFQKPLAILRGQNDAQDSIEFNRELMRSMKSYPWASTGIISGGNIFYNSSHPLLDLIVGHLESENESPYHSKHYIERIFQIWAEGETGEVPTIAPKIMIDGDKFDKIEEIEGCVSSGDERILFDLPNNTAKFRSWYKAFSVGKPFKTTTIIENYAMSARLPRHISEDAYLIHGVNLYDAYNSTKHGDITLLISEAPGTTAGKTLLSLKKKNKDRPFSRVLVMTGDERDAKDIREANKLSALPTTMQRRKRPTYANMDLCEAKIDTKWFMMVDSRREVSEFVDLMFADNRPVVPYVAESYRECGRFPYCEKMSKRARRISNTYGFAKIVHTDDMLFHTDGVRNFCKFWTHKHGDSLLKRAATSDGPVGPTASEYVAYLEKVEEDSWEYTVKKRGKKDCMVFCSSARVYSRKKGYEDVPGSSLYRFTNRVWYRKPFAFSPHPNSIEELVGKPPSMLTKSAATSSQKVLKKHVVEDLRVRVAEE